MALRPSDPGPAVTAIRALLPDPVRRGDSLRSRPRWVVRFAVLAGLYVILGLAGSAGRTALTERWLPPAATAEARDAAGEALLGGMGIRSLFLPVRLLAGWSTFALLLYYACRIWNAREGYRFAQILAAEVYAEGAVFAGAVTAFAAVLLGRGGPAVPWIPLGLDMVVTAEDFTGRYALNSFNVFSAAYVVLLSVSVSAMIGLARTKAFISVIAP